MLFFKEKEEMGLEASLKLLDLSPEATIDDANQAYTYLHRMIDLFHQDNTDGKKGSRQEDMDLLTCAYEKAIACLSDRDPRSAPRIPDPSGCPSADDRGKSRDLHFTINIPGVGVTTREGAPEIDGRLTEPDEQTVDDAIAIITRRLQSAENALPAAQRAMESALAAVAASSRRHEQAKQARLNAVVAAKSARSRALLMEVEAQRAAQEAIALAEKARVRADAARQAAGDARREAEAARKRAGRVAQSEETAAAEVVCAEDHLERMKDHLKALTHSLLKERERMKLFQCARAESPAILEAEDLDSDRGTPACRELAGLAPDRQQIMADLLAIESSLQSRHRQGRETADGHADPSEPAEMPDERRRYPRLAYPSDRRPLLCIDGRDIPVMDLSTTGMGLAPDEFLDGLRVVRGTLSLDGRQPVKVAGRVVRQDTSGLGLKLVTRIGDHLLDQERLRLSA